MTPLPLNDFRAIDLTAHRAGPTAVRQLADWGAQVIKIEPSGQLVDATGSRRDGPDFQNLHRNKRAMTLNLKSEEGHAIFMKLAERADVTAGALAHGEKRALEIAMVLATRPRLLLLDEPMAGMGPAESAEMVRLLARLRGTLAIVLVEHDMDAVFALADRITVMVYGRVIASGAPVSGRTRLLRDSIC